MAVFTLEHDWTNVWFYLFTLFCFHLWCQRVSWNHVCFRSFLPRVNLVLKWIHRGKNRPISLRCQNGTFLDVLFCCMSKWTISHMLQAGSPDTSGDILQSFAGNGAELKWRRCFVSGHLYLHFRNPLAEHVALTFWHQLLLSIFGYGAGADPLPFPPLLRPRTHMARAGERTDVLNVVAASFTQLRSLNPCLAVLFSGRLLLNGPPPN